MRELNLKRFVKSTALAFVVGVTAQAGAVEQPNIVIIFNDDLGYADVGCFGSETNRTPRIDQLAKEGRKFTSFYVGSSVCSASRASLMTGRYPQNVEVHGVYFPNRSKPGLPNGLDPKYFSIPKLFKTVGYKTLLAGKWHLGDEPKYLPTRHGFDTFYGIPYSNDMYPAKEMKYADDCLYLEGMTPEKIKAAFEGLPEGKQPKMGNKVPLMRDEACIEFPLDQTTITRRLADESIRFIEESVAEEKPFFILLTNPMPHTPLYVSPAFDGKTGQGLYSDVIAEIDFNTGRVLEALKANGVDENTLIIFSSDNGPWLIKSTQGGSAGPLRDGKGSSFEGGFRVPCIMRWPAKIPANTECTEIASTIDLLPTFAAITGAKIPADAQLDGHAIESLMVDAAAKSPHDAFYFAKNGIRVGDWKFYRGPRHSHWAFPKAQMPKDNPREQYLFNLKSDVGETTNVMDQYPEVTERLMQQLGEHLGKQISAPKQVTRPKPAPALTAATKPSESAPPVGTRYEIESGELVGEVLVRERSNASGGQQVGNLQKPGAAVVLTVDGGAAGGTFDAVLGYASLKGARLSLKVNGIVQKESLSPTGGWSDFKAVALSVSLKPGTDNRIEIQCPGANLDYLDLKAQ